MSYFILQLTPKSSKGDFPHKSKFSDSCSSKAPSGVWGKTEQLIVLIT